MRWLARQWQAGQHPFVRPAAPLFLAFERFGFFGVYGGTFDDPDWFERTQISRHIFLDSRSRGQ
jgi:hypothetical protein